MTTITKAPNTAVFGSTLSNLRRPLKKLALALGHELSTEQCAAFLRQEPLEEGGRYFYVEAEVTATLTQADQSATVDVAQAAPVAPAAPKAAKSRSVIQNGVRQPIKGLCADVWAELTNMIDGENQDVCPVTIADVRKLAEQKGWNVNNATIEFYGWRKFHGYNVKK